MSSKNFLVNQSSQKYRHIWLQDSELTVKVVSVPIVLLPILLIQEKSFAKFAIMTS